MVGLRVEDERSTNPKNSFQIKFRKWKTS